MSAIAIAVDTNILAYNIGVTRNEEDEAKVDRARALLADLLESAVLHVCNQALAELYNLLTKTALARAEAAEQIEFVQGMMTTWPVSQTVFDQALILAETKRFQIFDAIILSSAIDVGAAVLLSEDMQHSSKWAQTVILNPFKPDFEQRLAQIGE